MTVEHYLLRSMAFSVICSWLGLQYQKLIPSCEQALSPVKAVAVSPPDKACHCCTTVDLLPACHCQATQALQLDSLFSSSSHSISLQHQTQSIREYLSRYRASHLYCTYPYRSQLLTQHLLTIVETVLREAQHPCSQKLFPRHDKNWIYQKLHREMPSLTVFRKNQLC